MTGRSHYFRSNTQFFNKIGQNRSYNLDAIDSFSLIHTAPGMPAVFAFYGHGVKASRDVSVMAVIALVNCGKSGDESG
jgi:hypothetical protein